MSVSIGHENYFHSGILPMTYSSQRNALSFTNTADPNPHKPWQTLGCSDEWVVFDFNAFLYLGGYAFAFGWYNTNLTKNTVIRFQWNATNTWGAPSAENSIVPPADVYDPTGVRAFNKGFYGIQDSLGVQVHTQRYFRLKFEDPTNSDGFLRFGILFLGTAWLGAGSSIPWNQNYDDPSKKMTSLSGHVHSRPIVPKEWVTVRMNFTDADETQVIRSLARQGIAQETFITIGVGNDIEQEQCTLCYYGRHKNTPDLKRFLR